MTGTIRTLDTAMQNLIHEKIKLTASKIAEASGATAETIIEKKTLVTYNDPTLTKLMIPSLIKAAGESNVEEVPAITGAEDFSFFAEKVPSLFFFIGGKQKGVDPEKVFPHHTPDFWIDESGMKTGIKAFCNLVFDYMSMPQALSLEKEKKAF
jgi:amidohydrolase